MNKIRNFIDVLEDWDKPNLTVSEIVYINYTIITFTKKDPYYPLNFTPQTFSIILQPKNYCYRIIQSKLHNFIKIKNNKNLYNLINTDNGKIVSEEWYEKIVCFEIYKCAVVNNGGFDYLLDLKTNKIVTNKYLAIRVIPFYYDFCAYVTENDFFLINTKGKKYTKMKFNRIDAFKGFVYSNDIEYKLDDILTKQ